MQKRMLIRGLTLTIALLLTGILARGKYLREESEGRINMPAVVAYQEANENLKETTGQYQNLYANGTFEEINLPEKVMFLTFDDGPSRNTEKILDILKEHQAKATFFLIGENLTEDGVRIAKRALSEGHMLGLHTETHQYDKIYASVDAFLSDYDMLAERFRETFGDCPGIFRFPGGSCSCFINPIRKELKAEMKKRGFLLYDWTISGEDAVGTPTAASIKRNIFNNLSKKEAPILLLHDAPGNSLTAELLPELLTKLEGEGYVFLTLRNRAPYQFPW